MWLFQSTLPYGSDGSQARAQHARPLFQSTLPYGSDTAPALTVPPNTYFNPRSLTGATIRAAIFFMDASISIHAPLRERRNMVVKLNNATDISIHAPLRERLRNASISDAYGQISIHAPLRERQLEPGIRAARFVFQSTLPYGSDIRKTSSCVQ